MTRINESWAHHATQPAAVDMMFTDIPRTRNTAEELRLATACVHRHAPETRQKNYASPPPACTVTHPPTPASKSSTP